MTRIVQEIFHTSLTVGDLDRSLAFYCGVLGFEVDAQWETTSIPLRTLSGYAQADVRIALLKLPTLLGRSGHHLELMEYRSPRGTRGDANTYNPGSAHIAFLVEDLDAVYDQLKAKGVRFKSDPVEITKGRFQGLKLVYLLDPDEITLELVGPASAGQAS